MLGQTRGYNFFDPGFPSMIVSYAVSNDFFYSGHTGFPLIIGFALDRQGYKYAKITGIVGCVVMIFTMLGTRGHYSFDLFWALTFTHYSYLLANYFSQFADKSDRFGMDFKGILKNKEYDTIWLK